MLVLSAMLAPASAGEAATSRACCEELLANTPPPRPVRQSTNPPTKHQRQPAPACRRTSTRATASRSTSGLAAPMRRVAQTLPITPARPNSTSASDSVFGDGQRVRNKRRDVGEGGELAGCRYRCDHQNRDQRRMPHHLPPRIAESDVPCSPAGTTRSTISRRARRVRRTGQTSGAPAEVRTEPCRQWVLPATEATDQPRKTVVIAAARRSGAMTIPALLPLAE